MKLQNTKEMFVSKFNLQSSLSLDIVDTDNQERYEGESDHGQN